MFSKVAGEVFAGKGNPEIRLEGGKADSSGGKSTVGKGNSKCKGPETGVCLDCVVNRGKASVAGEE